MFATTPRTLLKFAKAAKKAARTIADVNERDLYERMNANLDKDEDEAGVWDVDEAKWPWLDDDDIPF